MVFGGMHRLNGTGNRRPKKEPESEGERREGGLARDVSQRLGEVL